MHHQVIYSLLALATVLPTHAFTNGTLIPSYICNPNPDGLPKSLGQLIPLLQEDGNPLAFNSSTTFNLATVPMTGSNAPGNAGYIIASFHNTLNKITPIDPGLGVTLASGATTLTAGIPNLLILNSLATGKALDGALLHARNANGTPVGSYVDAGGVFVNFPGCGKNAQGQFNGVVHSMIISANETYKALSYTPPKCGNAPVTLGGLSVTDNGFGVWNYTFPVTGGLPIDADGDCNGDTTTTTSTSTIITEVLAGDLVNLGGISIKSKQTRRGTVESRD